MTDPIVGRCELPSQASLSDREHTLMRLEMKEIREMLERILALAEEQAAGADEPRE